MRSGTTTRAFALRLGSVALKGLNKYIDYYYPGLAPRAMQECRPKGLLYDEIRNKLLGYFNALTLHV